MPTWEINEPSYQTDFGGYRGIYVRMGNQDVLWYFPRKAMQSVGLFRSALKAYSERRKRCLETIL